MSGKVKVKQLKKVVGDVNINGMFEEMMGVKDAEPEIIVPKFVLIRNNLRYVCRVLHQFCKMLGADFPAFAPHFADIIKFAVDMKESTYLKHDNDETTEPYAGLKKDEINGLYRKLKENSYVRQLIVLCSKLKRYETNFSDPANLKENFINQEPGLTFHVFDFSGLDLKAIWAHERVKPAVKKYILTVLSLLYKHTREIYKCVTSPDVDVEKFTHLLVNALGELKKQPRLHRCVNAFRRIEQSVQLLNDKFDDYYRESVASQNADMLVMNFIVDVSNQGGANATLAREFRTIIKYMHDMSNKSGKNKDPNVQKVFKMLNNNFDLMERQGGFKAPAYDEPEATTDMDELKTTGEIQEGTSRADKQKAKKKEKKKAKKKMGDLEAVAEVDDQADEVENEVENEQVDEVDENEVENEQVDEVENEVENEVDAPDNEHVAEQVDAAAK